MLIRWTLFIVLKRQNKVYVRENLKPFSQNQLSIRYSNFEERQSTRNCEEIHHFDITFSGVLKSVKSCLTFLLCILFGRNEAVSSKKYKQTCFLFQNMHLPKYIDLKLIKKHTVCMTSNRSIKREKLNDRHISQASWKCWSLS